MQWMIPGTVLRIERQEAQHIESLFSSMFLAGGMVLSQVCAITGLEPHTVQNWVKRGFLPPPEKKHYSMNQLCRVITINMLKRELPLERSCALLAYVNGRLDDRGDDIIDDTALYFMFVRLAARAKELYNAQERDAVLKSILDEYIEPLPGAKQRVEKALRIMLTAWLAARMGQEAERMMQQLEQ